MNLEICKECPDLIVYFDEERPASCAFNGIPAFKVDQKNCWECREANEEIKNEGFEM